MTDAHAPINDNEPVQPTGTLLLVDDEPNVLKSLRRLFYSDGYQIVTAENGAAGLAVLEQKPIDVIISDMRMPQMDGAEFLAEAAKRWPDTARILLTGFADLDSAISAVNQGRIFSYCSKPWDDDDLKLRVKLALEQKRLREERDRLFDIIRQQNQTLEEKVEKRTQQLRQSLLRIDHAHNDLKKQYLDSIKAFAKIIEMRPGIKSGHSKYIAECARDLAPKLGVEVHDIKDIVYGGLLSQIGKISLPDSLLTLPHHEMTSQQKRRYLNHAVEGGDLLTGIEPLHIAASFVRHQYERFDGKGHPIGLAGADIPLGARILAVVRDYLAYLDGEITGTAMTPAQVKHVLFSHRHSDYDPYVVDAFLEWLAETEHKGERPVIEISWTQLQAGMEVAEVICNDMLYLRDQIVTDKQVEDILRLRKNGRDLILRVRLGSDQLPE